MLWNIKLDFFWTSSALLGTHLFILQSYTRFDVIYSIDRDVCMHLNCSMNKSINDNVCLEYFGNMLMKNVNLIYTWGIFVKFRSDNWKLFIHEAGFNVSPLQDRQSQNFFLFENHNSLWRLLPKMTFACWHVNDIHW